MKNIKKIVKSIRDFSENTKVLLFGIINREDGNMVNVRDLFLLKIIISMVHVLTKGDYI